MSLSPWAGLPLLLIICICTWILISPWQRVYTAHVAQPVPGFLSLLSPLPQTVLTGCIGAAVLLWGTYSGATFDAVCALPVTALLTAAASVDVVCHRLPNVLLAWAGGFAGASTVTLTAINNDFSILLTALGASVLAGGATLTLSLIGSGMGFGDVKLMFVIGLWLGASGLTVPLWALTGGFLLAGPVALIGLLIGKLHGKDTLAFGPYLVLASLLVWASARY